MVVQAIIDSLSRCLGAPGGIAHPHATNNNVNGTTGVSDVNISNPKIEGNGNSRRNRQAEEGEALAARRRQGRALGLELHDQEWDALFEKDTSNNKKSTGRNNSSDKASFLTGKNSPPHKDRNDEGSSGSNSKPKSPDIDVGYASVFAKAKEAAQPARHTTPRKSTVDRKADIFRSRTAPNPSFASRLLASDAVFKALCFANPVHDCNIMPYGRREKNVDANCEEDDCSVQSQLSTAEETMTSTVCFENKYNHQMENRPPMPLFDRYKVGCDVIKDNELISIVNSGSHQSIHMLKEFERHNSLKHPNLFDKRHNSGPFSVAPVADDLSNDLDSQEQSTGKRRSTSREKSQNERSQERQHVPEVLPTKDVNKKSSSFYPFKGESPPDVQAISDSMSTNISSPSHQSMSSMKVPQENDGNVITVDLNELNHRNATDSQQVFSLSRRGLAN